MIDQLLICYWPARLRSPAVAPPPPPSARHREGGGGATAVRLYNYWTLCRCVECFPGFVLPGTSLSESESCSSWAAQLNVPSTFPKRSHNCSLLMIDIDVISCIEWRGGRSYVCEPITELKVWSPELLEASVSREAQDWWRGGRGGSFRNMFNIRLLDLKHKTAENSSENVIFFC